MRACLKSVLSLCLSRLLRYSMVAYETYASALITKGHGHPLWEPDPGDYPGVELGDVGFIDEGGFIRLFNASAGNDDPRNHFGLPQGHSRLLTGRIKRRTPLPKEPRYIASKGIQSTGVDLSITAGQVIHMFTGRYCRFLTRNLSPQGVRASRRWCQLRMFPEARWIADFGRSSLSRRRCRAKTILQVHH